MSRKGSKTFSRDLCSIYQRIVSRAGGKTIKVERLRDQNELKFARNRRKKSDSLKSGEAQVIPSFPASAEADPGLFHCSHPECTWKRVKNLWKKEFDFCKNVIFVFWLHKFINTWYSYTWYLGNRLFVGSLLLRHHVLISYLQCLELHAFL